MRKENLLNNLVLSTDSYKFSHFTQMPPNTKNIFSYIESRGSDYSNEIVMFGLQYYIKKYLTTPITMEDVEDAREFTQKHGLPFNYDGWKYIVEHHKGILPIKIRAVPEGTVMPNRNVMVTVEATDPLCFWVTSYMETDILRSVWYGSSVATISYLCKRIIKSYLDKTSDNPEAEIGFKLHDFGSRGCSSLETAGIGGAAHLINFMGTDTVAGVLTAMEYYDSDVCGFSIPAMEHSTVTPWGRDGEEAAFRNMIEHYAKPGALFACVSDSYDIYNATSHIWGDILLPIVKERGATVVIRPDSGDPLTVPIEVIKLLMDKVGYTINTKGYKVLPDYVRVIQGDGITIESLPIILHNLEAEGISASNIAFGMGGGLLQKVDRDTFRFAMKCSAAHVDGEWIDVYKDPIGDSGKTSKKGKVRLINRPDVGIMTIRDEDIEWDDKELLKLVYKNGKLYNTQTFDEVRANANRPFVY